GERGGQAATPTSSSTASSRTSATSLPARRLAGWCAFAPTAARSWRWRRNEHARSGRVTEDAAVDDQAFAAGAGLELGPAVGVPDVGVEHVAGMDRLREAPLDRAEAAGVAVA